MDDVEEPEDLARPPAHGRQGGTHGRRRPRAFKLEKRKRHGGQDDVVPPAAIAPAFTMIEPEVIFEFAVLLLDGPAASGQRDEVRERRRRREVEQIVFPDVGGAFAQQPAVAAALRRAHAHGVERACRFIMELRGWFPSARISVNSSAAATCTTGC